MTGRSADAPLGSLGLKYAALDLVRSAAQLQTALAAAVGALRILLPPELEAEACCRQQLAGLAALPGADRRTEG